MTFELEIDDLWLLDIKYIIQDKQPKFQMKYKFKLFKIDSDCTNDQKLIKCLSNLVNKNKLAIQNDFENINKQIFSKVYLLKINDSFQGVRLSFGINIKENKAGKFKFQVKIKEKELESYLTDKIGLINHIKTKLVERIFKEID